MSLTLKESFLLSEAEEDRKRRDDLNYLEKKTKGVVERVIVELNGNESGVLTKLASRYDRLDKAIKVMGQKKNELNASIKEKAEDLYHKYQAEIILLPKRRIDISSTEIRQRITEKRSIRYMVPEPVRNYITEHGLYQKA